MVNLAMNVRKKYKNKSKNTLKNRCILLMHYDAWKFIEKKKKTDPGGSKMKSGKLSKEKKKDDIKRTIPVADQLT